jgi:hypothetical protein
MRISLMHYQNPSRRSYSGFFDGSIRLDSKKRTRSVRVLDYFEKSELLIDGLPE